MTPDLVTYLRRRALAENHNDPDNSEAGKLLAALGGGAHLYVLDGKMHCRCVPDDELLRTLRYWHSPDRGAVHVPDCLGCKKLAGLGEPTAARQ